MTVASSPPSVVRGPLVDGASEQGENATSEADRLWSVVRGPLMGGAIEPSENATTKASVGCEKFTNEPTGPSSVVVVTPFTEYGFVDCAGTATETNEPIATNPGLRAIDWLGQLD